MLLYLGGCVAAGLNFLAHVVHETPRGRLDFTGLPCCLLVRQTVIGRGGCCSCLCAYCSFGLVAANIVTTNRTNESSPLDPRKAATFSVANASANEVEMATLAMPVVVGARPCKDWLEGRRREDLCLLILSHSGLQVLNMGRLFLSLWHMAVVVGVKEEVSVPPSPSTSPAEEEYGAGSSSAP